MSTYGLSGLSGSITTTTLLNGDVAVSFPASGPLGEIAVEACHGLGHVGRGQGRWIVSKANVAALHDALDRKCTKLRH